ncbi:MAG: threonylcarbamoyl-AMP synthase [Patescibacteria group bacterium]|nr:threonylcarbamoyl-AMP synthase [Patescibacteria group bacterium]
MNKLKTAKVIKALREGGMGVMPTDTIYGLVGSALNKRTVYRLIRLRRRDLKKPFIILISSVGDLELFDITPGRRTQALLKMWWPGKVSVIMPLKRDQGIRRAFAYLHRGTNRLAFRLPKPAWLRNLLSETGPLVAPSANLPDKPAVRTVREAKKYFGNRVDFYWDAGKLERKPSALVRIDGRGVTVLRPGAAAGISVLKNH